VITHIRIVIGQHNMKLAPATLGVHVNTPRQWLDVPREITGGWDDLVKSLESHVALRLRAIPAQSGFRPQLRPCRPTSIFGIELDDGPSSS